jgi:hypothetical protein
VVKSVQVGHKKYSYLENRNMWEVEIKMMFETEEVFFNGRI